ncbi:unnamed protein product [marine sediment metagenome]|uniref:Uncharacterized protein n=1 Tax=marine sediment metagenome TaxID=412755 RepID=X1CUU5_9ZZZZ
MPESNERTTPTPDKQEICTIRIIFPVESDEDAIECKKKIQNTLSDKPDVLFDFTIKSMPPTPTMRG